MIAAIAIDAWKLSTFKRCLEADGYKFTEHDGPGCIILRVQCDRVALLQQTVARAQRECRG